MSKGRTQKQRPPKPEKDAPIAPAPSTLPGVAIAFRITDAGISRAIGTLNGMKELMILEDTGDQSYTVPVVQPFQITDAVKVASEVLRAKNLTGQRQISGVALAQIASALMVAAEIAAKATQFISAAQQRAAQQKPVPPIVSSVGSSRPTNKGPMPN